jgi:CDP-glucose 4,6-dehydratase
MFADAYRGRRVFVTGHTGFKGAWLTLWLLDLGAHVTGFALEPPTEPSLFNAVGVGRDGARRTASAGRLTDLRGDVRARGELGAAVGDAAPEIVFHLAAQPLVRRSYEEPHLTYETNVMGTVDLLEAVRDLSDSGRAPRVAVIITSDKCYENLEITHAYAESDRLGGWDPYSSSKGCCELVAQAYGRSFFAGLEAPQIATARAGNVIGGGDWGEDRILPDCARAIASGRPVEVRNPDAVRPWQHVLESLSGYLWLGACACGAGAAHGAGPEPDTPSSRASIRGAWNFGPSSDARVTVREVVEQFLQTWGEGDWRPAQGAAQQPHEAGLLVLDAGKAERDLGWRPAWTAQEAVTRAAHWYRDYYAGAGPEAALARCRGDIADYAAAAAGRAIAWASNGDKA